MTHHLAIAGLVTISALGCELLNPPKDEDTGDVRPTPDTPYDPNTGECATNWRVMEAGDLGTRARVENERLVLEPGGGLVSVEGLLGVPPGGRGAVLRFDFYQVDLGSDGRFDVEMIAPEGTVARLIVQPKGAVLTVEAMPYGSNAEISFPTPPERMTFELDLKADNGLEARAFFFEAGRGKVLQANVPRFDGGMVTNALTLKGASAVVKLERFARIDPGNGGLMEDFWCDSLGTTRDRYRFPEGRASKAGKPCDHDNKCGAGELCNDGTCRRACLASSQCLDQICIVHDDGGLCSMPNVACDPSADEACGPDGKLRNACRSANDCPRPEDLCLGGACMSNDEEVTRDGDLWGTCDFGESRCEDDAVETCDTVKPGWNKVEQCQEDQCKSNGRDSFCDACVRSCGGTHAEDVYASCDGGAPELDIDCKDAFQVCSTGDTNSDPAFCRDIVPGEPPSLAVEVGNGTHTWDIDPTEVTRAQYARFLQSAPSMVSQTADCDWNQTYRPPDWPFYDSPERAVQVDYCDAVAYCDHVGKHLCTPQEWYDTCSQGGAYDFPYGNEYESGLCSIDPRRDVGSDPECGSPSGPFSGVLDMIGGVGEWIDACQHGSTSVRAADSCKTRGTSVSQSCEIERTVRRDSIAGIRCCSE